MRLLSKLQLVMAGLVPAMTSATGPWDEFVDARHKAGHDDWKGASIE
jgi:hypothetical protein